MEKTKIKTSILMFILVFSAVFVSLNITNFIVKNDSITQVSQALYKPVSSEPHFLDVNISPETVKLNPNEKCTFVATVSNSVGKVFYDWSVRNIDGNFTNYTFTQNKETSSFTFNSATEDVFILTVEVSDDKGRGSASTTIRDPYTSRDIYLNTYGMPYSYLIETDGNGWYRAVNGTDGSISFTSTDGATVINNIENALVLTGGGSICLQGNIATYSTINAYPGISIFGLGQSATSSAGYNCIVYSASLNAPVISFTHTTPYNSSIANKITYFEGFSLISSDGGYNSTATLQDGIKISETSGLLYDLYINDVHIFNCGGQGVNINSHIKVWLHKCYIENIAQNGFVAQNGTTIDIMACKISYCGLNTALATQAGIRAGVDGTIQQLNIGQGSSVAKCPVGLYLSASTNGITVNDCYIWDNGNSSTGYVNCFIGGSGGLNGIIQFTASRIYSTVSVATAPNYLFYWTSGTVNLDIQNCVLRTNKGTSNMIYVGDNRCNLTVRNCDGFNDLRGKLTTPFYQAAAANTTGLGGNAADPVANVTYRVYGSDLMLTSTGGSDVSITVYTAAGDTIASGLTTLSGQVLKVGQKIAFGNFSVAPTVTACVI